MRWTAPVVVAIVVAVAVAHGQGGPERRKPPVEIPRGEDCSACHAALTSATFVHKPVSQGCDNCHAQDGTKHAFALSEPLEKLCVGCHDKLEHKGKKLHPPVQKGQCTSCHDPHGGHEKRFLKPQPAACAPCHAKEAMQKEAFVHGPASRDCSACHDGHSAAADKLLVKEPAELCASCHKELASAIDPKLTHKPVREGECLACHVPHQAGSRELLSQTAPALCYECHSELKDAVSKAKTQHKALESARSCAACHDPHGRGKLLRAPSEGPVCLECHKALAEQLEKGASQHAPARKGECLACHEPHAGGFRLLKLGYPDKPYAAFGKDTYALCFECHEQELVTEKETQKATGFRDGSRNLHALHVARKKGRSCRFCHDVHAASGPKLIRSSFKFGNWEAPVGFEPRDSGGRCSPGCHVPKEYDRSSPASQRSGG